MVRRHVQVALAAGLLACAAGRAELVTARITAEPSRLGKLVITGSGDSPFWTIDVDLSGLPRQGKIHGGHLYVPRSEPLSGREEWALTNIEVTAADRTSAKLVGPWYDCFDLTGWLRSGGAASFRLDGSTMVDAKKISLALEYEGKLTDPPRQPTGLRAVHRAGQTFITWLEIEKRITDEPVAWGVLRKALEEMDARRVVRYRVYRHTQPVTAKNIAAAEMLAEVQPLSCYNVEGRSVERLISMHRRRAVEDIAFARRLARTDYFGRYHVDMPEMAEVVVDRFVIDDSRKPLPPGAGLYVHNPSKAGQAYYAVATCVDGLTNTVDFTPANATSKPVDETVGVGEPVFQAAGTLKVFYDYPGERRYYVQWAGPSVPPLSNLPNQYYNWSVYLPPELPRPAPVRMVFAKDLFMRPSTIHRRDTILISGRDGPVWSFWYGYHEALGTLKSFRQGVVRPYTKRRMFAFIDWVMKEFNGDPQRLSAVGGTDALYYGVKHGDRFAYVLANAPDPDPQVTPVVTRIDNYIRRRPRAEMEHVWGKVDWKIPGEDGKSVWEEMDLIAFVKEDPTRELAFLSMGPASLSAPWPRQVEFMKALWAAKQPFCARFYWGGGSYLPLPEGVVGAKDAFDFALDIPMLSLRNNSNDRGLTSKRWTEGEAGYWGGGRIADGRRWLADFVDEPGRFEITIHGGGAVTYAGGGSSDVTPRRTRKFKPRPGEKFRWENVPLGGRGQAQSGEVVADEHGLVTIPQVSFSGPSRLKITRAD